MHTLTEQYKLVQSSREVVLSYCERIQQEHFEKELENFNSSSIKSMLLHIANTYLFWFSGFASHEETKYFEEADVKNAVDMRKIFAEVDKLVIEFLSAYNDINTPIEGYIFWLKKKQMESPLSLFSHIVTHEFHHKGQIMTMSRQLGYTPPDADVIRF